MPRPSLLPLGILTLLAAAPRVSAQVIRVGDPLPPVVLEGLTQTGAHSFADFYGRTVMLEFFAYWCGPCARVVPHVNEIQDKFGPRGLSVIGVTAEAAAKTVPWIEKTGAKYAYGYDTTNALHQGFQINSIPFTALIDPYGTVVWAGHPQRLTEEKIEKALEGALERPVWTWPEAARPLAVPLARGQFAAALEQAGKRAPQGDFDARTLIEHDISQRVAKLENYVEHKDYSDAVRFGTRLETQLAGLPQGETVASRMKALREDPAVMREVAAADALTELEARASTVRKASEARKIRDEVAEFLEKEKGLRYERRARNLLEALDQALDRAGKAPHEDS